MQRIYFFLTIHAENPQNELKSGKITESVLSGRCAGKFYGYPKFLELLEKWQIKANFFINTDEVHVIDEEEVATMAGEIARQGHEVCLTLHPEYADEKGRMMMSQYTLDEQTALIRNGRELLKKWSGQAVNVFRAPYFSADENTLKALVKCGMKGDSSYLFKNKNCSLAGRMNQLFRVQGIQVFPVTTYYRAKWLKFGNFKIAYSKTLVPMIFEEIEPAEMDEVAKLGAEYFNFVINITDFLDFSGPSPTCSSQKLQKFTRLMENFRNMTGCHFITFRDYFEQGPVNRHLKGDEKIYAV